MRVATLLIGLLYGLAAAHADFSTGYRAYERGDYEAAFTEFSKAARGGHGAAQISLGWMFAQGLGVVQDDRLALYWYRQAAGEGHRDAQAILDIRRLGTLQEGQETPVKHAPNGNGDLSQDRGDPTQYAERNPNEPALEESGSAAYWHRKSAEKGRRDAQFALGVRYELGQGAPRDTLQAIYWFRKAAQQGSVLAQFNLGLKYAIGEGVPYDEATAIYWYQKAAAKGHLESQFLLGVAYAKGQGVAPAPDEAVHWWRKAAQGGYARAQYHLGLMYAQGDGVSRDWSQAYLWLTLAAAQGHDEARLARDEVRAHLDPTEMARVQQLARRWQSSGNPNPVTANDAKAPGGVLSIRYGLDRGELQETPDGRVAGRRGSS